MTNLKAPRDRRKRPRQTPYHRLQCRLLRLHHRHRNCSRYRLSLLSGKKGNWNKFLQLSSVGLTVHYNGPESDELLYFFNFGSRFFGPHQKLTLQTWNKIVVVVCVVVIVVANSTVDVGSGGVAFCPTSLYEQILPQIKRKPCSRTKTEGHK